MPKSDRQIDAPYASEPQAQRVTNATLPFVAAIASELRDAGQRDESSLLRTARRLLEDAFAAVEHMSFSVDPLFAAEVER